MLQGYVGVPVEVSKLGSPLFISQKRPFGRGTPPGLGDLLRIGYSMLFTSY